MEQMAGLKQMIQRLGFAKIGAMAVVAAAVLLMVGWIAARSVEPMGMLYSGLDPSEAGRIAQRLEELKIPYEAKGDGSVVMVPQSQVARTRMMLAASGLPHQGGTGYELLDSQSPMNMTSFMQKVQRLRALEGELARTIDTLNGVRSARVHIVLAERETFSRDTPKPTASVAVVTNGATRLGMAEAAAIRLLVAGAVAGLQQDDVTVLDPAGIVLAADGAASIIGGRVGEIKANNEQSLQRAVTELLEPLIGHGKVRVVASVDIDGTREVSREEKFDPLTQVERSKQSQVDVDNSEDTKPVNPVTVSQNLPNPAPPPTGTPGKSTTSSNHNGQTTNYEISSVHSETVREPGQIKRLTVAVVVDSALNDKGVAQPRSKEELERLSQLVKSAVGFDAKRGDIVTVDTMTFLPPELLGSGADLPLVAAATPWAIIAVGALVVLLVGGGAGVILMQRKRARLELAEAEAATALAASEDVTALEEKANGPSLPSPLVSLFELIDLRPEESLAVIRNWIADSEAA
jgi:flagellar M-ring protein FliF